VGTPLEVEHLNLGGTPPLVLAAFALNGLVVTFLADVLLKLRISRESLLLSRCTSSPSKRFIGAFTSVDGFLRGCTLGANIIWSIMIVLRGATTCFSRCSIGF